MIELSVRDRKRQITATHIHKIAEEMALKSSPAHIKVDDIASAATISRRTFFNYFATKEDAILGLQQPTLRDEALTTFKTSSDTLLSRTIQLIIDVNTTSIVNGSSFKKRIEIRKQFPELKARIDVYTTASEQLVRPIIENEAQDIDSEAVLRIAGAILRHAYGNDPDLSKDTIQQSTNTILETIKRIS